MSSPKLGVFEASVTFDRNLVLELMRLADDSDSEIHSYLKIGRLFLLLQEEEALPIGQLLVLSSSDSSVEIKNLSISKDRQREGLGSLLILQVLSKLKREGALRVTVATSTADLGNIAFYQKIGFRCLAIERDAFTQAHGYSVNLCDDGISIKDRIWFDLYL